MKNIRPRLVIAALAVSTLSALSACTKNDSSNTAPAGTAGTAGAPGTSTAPAEPTKADGNVKLENNITIASVGETMAFDKTDLYVKAGDQVKLKFVNNSTTLAHNWVLVKPGKSDDVGNAGMQAGAEKNYLPDSPDVIKATRLVPPKGQPYADKTSEKSTGESAQISFTAPAAGDYPYICTNAGHHTVMKGVLHAK